MELLYNENNAICSCLEGIESKLKTTDERLTVIEKNVDELFSPEKAALEKSNKKLSRQHGKHGNAAKTLMSYRLESPSKT